LLFFRMRGRATVVEVEFRGQGREDKRLIARHVQAMHVEVAAKLDSDFVQSLCKPFSTKPKHTYCRVEVVRSSAEDPGKKHVKVKDSEGNEIKMAFALPMHVVFMMSVIPGLFLLFLLICLRRYNPRRAAREGPFNRRDMLERGAGEQDLSSAFAEAQLEVIQEEEEFRERSVKDGTHHSACFSSPGTSEASTPLMDDATSMISTNTPGSHRGTLAYHRRRGNLVSQAVQDEGTSSTSVNAPESCRGFPNFRNERDVVEQDEMTSTDSSNAPEVRRASFVQHRAEGDSYPVFQDLALEQSQLSGKVEQEKDSSKQQTLHVKVDKHDAHDFADDGSEGDRSLERTASETETLEDSASWTGEDDDSEVAGGEGLHGGNADPGMYRYPVAKIVDKE